MIHLAGLEEGKDINIQYTGLRPGEKLYEELLNVKEKVKKTLYIYMIFGIYVSLVATTIFQ